jgi:predicted alpha/beta hydrolase
MHDIELTTADQTKIAATLFATAGNDVSHKGIVLIAGATAVPQGFYRRFALAMNARGFDALSFDFRGIGKSKPASLKGYTAHFRDWGEHDLQAALDFCSARGPVYLAGHSFGGHGIGMLKNRAAIRAAWICGTGAGYSGYMPTLERLRVGLLWNLLAPVSAAIKGYAPMSWFGIGEDLPMGVYRDWRHWCSFPHYFFDDPALANSEFLQRFQTCTTPMRWLNAVDDLWAKPASRDAFASGYRSANIERVDLTPADFGIRNIGHMGYYRQSMSALWEHAADYFEANV